MLSMPMTGRAYKKISGQPHSPSSVLNFDSLTKTPLTLGMFALTIVVLTRLNLFLILCSLQMSLTKSPDAQMAYLNKKSNPQTNLSYKN